MQDCDKAIELEPTFVKAYLRKAKVLQGMSQPSKAIAAYEKVLEMDPNCTEAVEGYKNCSIQVRNQKLQASTGLPVDSVRGDLMQTI